jgi:hypothetical protein
MFSCSTYIIKIIRAAKGQQKAAIFLVPKLRLGPAALKALLRLWDRPPFQFGQTKQRFEESHFLEEIGNQASIGSFFQRGHDEITFLVEY